MIHRNPHVTPAILPGGAEKSTAIVPDEMVSGDDVRRLALGLPDAYEQDHHGRPSFRVNGKIFATLWDPKHMNLLLDEPGIRTAAESRPACQEFWWGKRLRAVQLDLEQADEALAAELLTDAWEHKAPKRLLQSRPQSP
jgi:hypothetical protein